MKKSWSKGAKKAYASMLKTYGSKERAERVFYAKANKISGGRKAGTLNKRVSTAYKTGGKQKPSKKR